MKKSYFLGAVILTLVFLCGCNGAPGPAGGGVPFSGNADNIKGGTDADGFVRLPGEPSRGDSAYYIVEDVCGQFTVPFIEKISGKKIVKSKLAEYDPEYTCTYYTTFDEAKGYGDFFSVGLTYLNVADQKKGHEFLGRTIKTDPRIKMEHFISVQEDGLINEIFLLLNPNKFISINRSSGKAMSEDEVMNFAVKLADKIKNFK